MTSVDQFESLFKSAARTTYRFEEVGIAKILVVTDLESAQAQQLQSRVEVFLQALKEPTAPDWSILQGQDFRDVQQLLQRVEDEAADLICSYRHLHSQAWRWPYSLGEHLDVLTQVSSAPVLVVPHPLREPARSLDPISNVMAITDHLTGDHRLVNHALRFARGCGKLHLTHIEDEAAFERYLDVISKIPSIDTESARESILQRLLKEPHDYIASIVSEIERLGFAIEVGEIVSLGHRIADHERLVDENRVDLLVLNTKDDDQMAMHGLAYPLAVELRDVPMLML